MPLPKEATDRHIQSIMAGNAVMIGSGIYTKADMSPEDLAKGYVGSDVLINAENEARLMLSKELDESRARVAELEAQIAEGKTDASHPFDHAELLEDLIPKSKSGLESKSEETVAKIAAYRGLDTEGKEKAELIAELLKKPEAGE